MESSNIIRETMYFESNFCAKPGTFVKLIIVSYLKISFAPLPLEEEKRKGNPKLKITLQ